MTPFLLQYLCEPITKEPLKLVDAKMDKEGNIFSGNLITASEKIYPIIKGIPRFVDFVSTSTVESFGNEWNYFNFIDFKINWLSHTVKNTFGTTDIFKDKIIIDAGGGSGSQAKWFLEYGAKHIIVLELSNSVDEVIKNNLENLKNVDVIQCSIDAPPLCDKSINGIVYCHNVIQHTPSVEKTAHALYDLVAPGGEFVFNCYPLNDQGLLRWMRFYLIFRPLRLVLSNMPFSIIMSYSKLMAVLRLIPLLGRLLEKNGFVSQGDIPIIPEESFKMKLSRRFKNTALNTFDCFGSHQYQHYKSNKEILSLIESLQPDSSKVFNTNKYFTRPIPIGCALRIFR